VSATGMLLRLTIITVWLGLLGWHALGFFAPGVGRTLDTGSLLIPHLDRTLQYSLYKTGSKAVVGACRFGIAHDEARFRSTIHLELRDPSAIPGLSLLTKVLDGGNDQTMDATIEQQLDEQFRLLSVQARGTAFGVNVTADGRMDLQRFVGRYRLGAGTWTPFELPGLSADASAGTGLTVSLPPNLKPGDVFTTRFTTLDPIRMTATPATAEYTVENAEDLLLAAGQRIATVRVVMVVNRRPAAHLWCGSDGIAYRITLDGIGLSLDLTRLTDVIGQTLWPLPPPPNPAKTDKA